MAPEIIVKYLGPMIPLTSGPYPKDDTVDGLAKVNTASSGRLGPESVAVVVRQYRELC